MEYVAKKRLKREIAEFFEKQLKSGKPGLLKFSRISQNDLFRLLKTGTEHGLTDQEIFGVLSSILAMMKVLPDAFLEDQKLA